MLDRNWGLRTGLARSLNTASRQFQCKHEELTNSCADLQQVKAVVKRVVSFSVVLVVTGATLHQTPSVALFNSAHFAHDRLGSLVSTF